MARAGSEGIDLGAALDFSREVGGPASRSMTYSERTRLLEAAADKLIANRDAYLEIAYENSGNTIPDASIDVDGGIGTMKYFASLGQSLGDTRFLVEPRLDRLGRDSSFQATHLLTPLRSVPIHIDAFNFPSWGRWKKAAVACFLECPS
jgi:3,4-dehydroadipyl-CoA semialdehyde dehydrogenase